MKRLIYQKVLGTFLILCVLAINSISAQHSVARQWNEELLHAIRNDFARPTVHARNLFHTSIAMYDSWAVYSDTAQTFFLGNNIRGFEVPFDGIPQPVDIEAARRETMSFAVHRLLSYRFENSPGAATTLASFNTLFANLGYDPNNYSLDYSTGSPAALGNYIGSKLIDFGLQDGSNEANDFENQVYEPVNPPLVTNFEGNPDIIDPNRWQPLTLDVFIDQSGNEFPYNTPPFLSPEWGQVVPFAMTDDDLTFRQRDGDVYWLYHDPGDPPYLDTTVVGGISEEYKWGFSLVSVWSSHLDPESASDTLWDISPASIGNIQEYPTTIEGLRDFYDLENGGDTSPGHDLNPATGMPYTPQMISRADYGRVLAEFWADGPDSETPPGHWFTLLNYVSDHPMLEKRFRGQGPILSDLEWDVKSYFILGGAMHDAAITAWSCKGWYDYVRPISAIRGMADYGQSSDQNLPSYHPAGIPLIDGYIELVDSSDLLAGLEYEHVGKIKVMAWKGPDYINDPLVDFAGVGWILAENWWPYQRPSFVTPNFAGYVSGHSTFSRAAAEVMTLMTGDAYFPGGMGEFDAMQNQFLVFEQGPSTNMTLQWATYRDASDQCSLSRIWGGIHPPVDDMPGRFMGMEVGVDAFNYAQTFFFTDADEDGYFDFEDCDDNNANINPGVSEICNGIDENCNGLIDDETPIYTYYLDSDNDGFGDINNPLDTCQAFAPSTFVENSWDCDDTNSDINPDAMEACDEFDNNCDGQVNEGLDIYTYYVDGDGDGFGDEAQPLDTCAAFVPIGYASVAGDCDDINGDINPDAEEACDEFDNDCNGMVDDGLTTFMYFADADNDGYGNNEVSLESCLMQAPDGYVSNNQDCDDENENINPDASELCDGFDNDCNNMIDDGLEVFVYYYDADQDEFGDPTDSIETCADTPPDGYVTNSMDCDDFNNTINPDATEIANNGIDEDCLDGDFILAVENTFDEDMELFPNPFLDQITIRSDYTGELIVQIVNAKGQMIYNEPVMFNSGMHTLELNHIPPGIYFVMIQNDDATKRYFDKVVKQ